MAFRFRRRTKRFFKRLLLSTPFLAIGWFFYLLLRSPSSAPAATIAVDMSPQNVERGQYLFDAICACGSCHSERDYKKFAGPIDPKGIGKGQEMPFNGLPGTITAGNLTRDKETGLGNWSDGEKIRAIRDGVNKDGRALYPLMPYQYYRYLSDEDVQAIVAYMDSLPLAKSQLPRTSITFPTSMWIKGLPSPVFRVPPVDPDGGEAYGDYLTRIAACESCHTPLKGFQPDLNQRFAGGRDLDAFYGVVTVANITPDEGSGIGGWNYLQFEKRMRDYQNYRGNPPAITPKDFTLMAWESYSKMTDHDLESMFLYLRGVKAISNSTPGGKPFPELPPPLVQDPAVKKTVAPKTKDGKTKNTAKDHKRATR
jgi:mono/diheme cytochrome c family protein